MSLLSYSSPWINDTQDRGGNNAVSRKRTPTLGVVPRKTAKVRPTYDSATDKYEIYEQTESSSESNETSRKQIKMPESFDEYNDAQTDRTTKINSILNKITSFSSDDKLGDFNPMPYPAIIAKKNADQILSADEPVKNGENPLMPKTGKPVFANQSPIGPKPIYYRAAEPGSGSSQSQFASYRDAYGKEGLVSGLGTKEPYYAKMGITKGGEYSGDKVMDRLNYMTQMLEALQMEKTNHVTEEFVLYSLLGVFMIYIVDGFSRGGKYVR
jgi:hypothetical protein